MLLGNNIFFQVQSLNNAKCFFFNYDAQSVIEIIQSSKEDSWLIEAGKQFSVVVPC